MLEYFRETKAFRGEVLPGHGMSNNSNNEMDNVSCKDRRKRVNHIKTAIVILVIILLILPTICCIILGFQVNRLQNQVNDLLRTHGQYSSSYNSQGGDGYALAAEKEGTEADASYKEPIIDTNKDPNKATHSDSTVEPAKKDQPEEEVTTGEEVVAQKETQSHSEENFAGGTKETASEVIDEGVGIYHDKKVYLTFDDGPSIYTDEILDILAEYQVKATFFVVGKTDSRSKKLYQRIVDEGHSLGMHSYSHRYSEIYNSVEDFAKDFTKLWELLYDTTGYKPSIFRFPGGSDNKVNKNGMEDFIRYLNEAEIVYFDWNVLNGDATGVTYTKKQLTQNVLDGVAIKDNSIVLLHDAQTKKTTVDSLPGLLEKLLSGGAQILPLDKDVNPIQMIQADTIK